MKIGIIGGSGLYDLDGLENVEEVAVETPFGEPSAEYTRGFLSDKEVYFLPRHGKGHVLLPSEVNHKANIYGFKKLGVERIISITAVGSLQEDYRPRDIVLPDQYFDRTKKAMEHTFFGDGIVAHVSLGDPACASLRNAIADVAAKVIDGKDGDGRLHCGGTYINMEGPAFSTRAESQTYRKLGFDIIGMTSMAEARLCREAEICYQTMAMITDYDSWHESEEPVTSDAVVAHLMANTALAKEILQELIPALSENVDCSCGTALRSALFTDLSQAPEATKEKLAPILQNYL